MSDPTSDRPTTVDIDTDYDPDRTAVIRTTPPRTALTPAAATGPAAGPLPAAPPWRQPNAWPQWASWAPSETVAATRSRLEADLGQTVAVASFRQYDAAAGAVARMAGTGFPIDKITIVGGDLRILESVTGRLTPGQAAAMGTVSGAWFGALVAVLVGVFASSFGAFAGLLLWSLVLGAGFGAGFGLVGFLAVDRGRGFTSDRMVVAARYDLHTTADLADRLRGELLAHRTADVQIIDGHPR
jgi:hypothetical protein